MSSSTPDPVAGHRDPPAAPVEGTVKGAVEGTLEGAVEGAAHGVVVAVDGTSGSGKSSTSRGVAARLGMRYLDTGAMYRAVTWWMVSHGVDVHDPAAVAARAGEPVVESGTDPDAPTIHLDGVDVAVEIRSDAVNAAVSPVSVVPEVRARLAEQQRAEIRAALATGPGIVVEGRDIASVVWPEAAVKVFLSADPEARAARRAAEQGGTDVGATRESLLERDRIDSGRATAPLTMVDGAAHVDTTSHTLDEVVDRVVALVEAARVDA
ncbi:(d)CMP kinase [Nocardioides sp. SYSU D00038]|uniref:(d)CMP kinase n=1 Tax=Nocardioides sp. SYSU D00038 TaxID=2812554 RepID=UPI001967E314|nr:(d)CMP kinase [Nocardioides sp. SYSU D00038]